MMGSGTVLAMARAHGHYATGVDVDPLAVLLAQVWTTAADQEEIIDAGARALAGAKSIFDSLTYGSAYPPDCSAETRQFLRYWFDEYARRQLAALTIVIGRIRRRPIRDALWCAFSRLIITKSHGASLAMDLSHSRPHKAFHRAPMKPFDGFPAAVSLVAKNCVSTKAQNRGPRTTTMLGDARKLTTASSSFDLVLTSPPSVDFEGGEMSFGIFKYAENEAQAIMGDEGLTDIDKLQKLHSVLPGELFPSYVLEYISEDARLEDGTMCFHSASEFGAKSKSYSEEEIRTIRRRKSIFSNNEFKRGPRPSARHHLKIYYNSYGDARLFYKINGHSVKFIQNRR